MDWSSSEQQQPYAAAGALPGVRSSVPSATGKADHEVAPPPATDVGSAHVEAMS